MTLNKDVAKSRLSVAPAGDRFRQQPKPDNAGYCRLHRAAIPFWGLMTFLPLQIYTLLVLIGISVGIYLCHRTARDMDVHDHGQGPMDNDMTPPYGINVPK